MHIHIYIYIYTDLYICICIHTYLVGGRPVRARPARAQGCPQGPLSKQRRERQAPWQLPEQEKNWRRIPPSRTYFSRPYIHIYIYIHNIHKLCSHFEPASMVTFSTCCTCMFHTVASGDMNAGCDKAFLKELAVEANKAWEFPSPSLSDSFADPLTLPAR